MNQFRMKRMQIHTSAHGIGVTPLMKMKDWKVLMYSLAKNGLKICRKIKQLINLLFSYVIIIILKH